MSVTVLDTCVLYPPALRDLFMWLASARAYRPRWTNEIHEEWIRNVLKDRPELERETLERTRHLMDAIRPECLVVGYEHLTPNLILPDANDRHVLAAAIQTNASIIVTFNLSDFPATVLEAYHVRAEHPDSFLVSLFEQKPEVFLRGVRKHRASLRMPPKTVEEYILTLRTNQLPRLAAKLAFHQDEI